MYKRDIWKKLNKEINTKEIIVITGARQVGKTTTLKWIFDQIESKNKKYFDLELYSNRDIFNKKDYRSIINELELLGLNFDEKVYILLDEIQLVKELPSVVKYLYDHYGIKFFLSGSSSYYLKNRFSESMAGRKLIFEMFPLNFNEFLRFQDIEELPEMTFKEKNIFSAPTYQRLRSYYDEFVEFGGLPSVVLASDIERKKLLLEEIYSSYIRLDVETLADFRSISDFRLLIELLAQRVGSRLDISKLSQISGITRPTIYNYIEFLEQTYVIKLVNSYSKSPDTKSRLPKKVFFVNGGLLNIKSDVDIGAKFENAVFNQLSFYGDLSYYSSKRAEIDFIIDGEIGFEVKATPGRYDLNNLARLSNKLDLQEHYIVGKNYTESFDNFIFGGLL